MENKEKHPLTRYLSKYGEGRAEIGGFLVQVHHDGMRENPREMYDHTGELIIFPSTYAYRRDNYSHLSDPGLQFGNNWSVWEILCRITDYNESDENARMYPEGIGDVYMPDEWHHMRNMGLLDAQTIYIPLDVRDYGSNGLHIRESNDAEWEKWGGILYARKTDDEEENARILNYLKAELAELNNWLEGSVYGFTIEKEGEEIDSCWGFYGDHDTSGLFDCIMHTVAPLSQTNTTQEEGK